MYMTDRDVRYTLSWHLALALVSGIMRAWHTAYQVPLIQVRGKEEPLRHNTLLFCLRERDKRSSQSE